MEMMSAHPMCGARRRWRASRAACARSCCAAKRFAWSIATTSHAFDFEGGAVSTQPTETETFDLQRLAETLAQLGGLMAEQVPGLHHVLTAVDEAAYRRGYKEAAAEAAELRECLIGIQRELAELSAQHREQLGERADTTV